MFNQSRNILDVSWSGLDVDELYYNRYEVSLGNERGNSDVALWLETMKTSMTFTTGILAVKEYYLTISVINPCGQHVTRVLKVDTF